MLENIKLSTRKTLKVCGSCGKVCSKPKNGGLRAVETSTFNIVEIVENFFKVYIIL